MHVTIQAFHPRLPADSKVIRALLPQYQVRRIFQRRSYHAYVIRYLLKLVEACDDLEIDPACHRSHQKGGSSTLICGFDVFDTSRVLILCWRYVPLGSNLSTRASCPNGCRAASENAFALNAWLWCCNYENSRQVRVT